MQSSGNSLPAPAPAARPESDGASWPTRKRFALTGRSRAFDPRVDAARGDLADIRLATRLFAPHYAAALVQSVVKQARLVPAIGAEPVSEVLVGECFDVLEISHGHAWGVSAVDGAVGYVALDALGPVMEPASIVCVPFAQLADGSRLPMGSRTALDGGKATCPLGAPMADFVAAAESLVGTPYKPGGRSGAGVDSAGLVVLALSLAGIAAPQFQDLQATALGHPVAADAPILRGDLLFDDAGVGIAIDAATVVQATEEGVGLAPIDRSGILIRRRLP